MNVHRAIRTAAVASSLLGLVFLASCASTPPPAPKPFGEIDHMESGEILAVNDTLIDARNPLNQGIEVHTPPVVLGGIVTSLPVRLGREGKKEVPAEEVTVRLASGKMFTVIQARSSPPLAQGERVRVLFGRRSEVTGKSKIRVEREEEPRL